MFRVFRQDVDSDSFLLFEFVVELKYLWNALIYDLFKKVSIFQDVLSLLAGNSKKGPTHLVLHLKRPALFPNERLSPFVNHEFGPQGCWYFKKI